MNKTKEIIKLYTNPEVPGSFKGIDGFKKNNPKFEKNDIEKALKDKDYYTLFKTAKRKFTKEKTRVNGIDDSWQIDLLDVSNIKSKIFKQNYTFLFVCIDVFSRFAWVQPMKNKSSSESARCFEIILKSGRKPNYIYSDSGNEFKGKFKNLLIKNKINQVFTKSLHKAALAERLNLELRDRFEKLFEFSKKKNYIDSLQNIVKSYNNEIHSAIGTSPSKVNKKNEKIIYEKLYGNEFSKDQLIYFIFKKGDYVRKIIDKNLFEKGYTANWSKDIFIIHALVPTIPPKYSIKNLENKIEINNFYQEELQKIEFKKFPFDTIRILKEKEEKVLVQKLNSLKDEKKWVSKSELEKEYTYNTRSKIKK
jgi:hypothetical protein